MTYLSLYFQSHDSLLLTCTPVYSTLGLSNMLDATMYTVRKYASVALYLAMKHQYAYGAQ